MKIECKKNKLLKAISKAEKVSSKNSSLPVLSCLILEAKEKKLFVKSTNLEIGLNIEIDANITKEGKIAVPANIFVSYVSNLNNDDDLILESKENNLFLSGENSKTKINILNTDDFPSIPDTSDQKSCEVSSKELVEGLKGVWYAASVSNLKPELSSVYIYSENNNLFFVATDSFRLAEKKIETKTDSFESVLIPQRNVLEIIRIFEDYDSKIKICFEDDKISFLIKGDIYLVTRVVDGNFPDYKQIIPKENKTEVVVLKNDLMNILKISNLFSDNFNQVNFLINSENNVFEIVSKNPEKGESVNILKTKIEGESLEINFNQKYIVDSFGSIHSENVVLNFNGVNKPLVIKGVGDGTFRYLVMPLNK